MEWMVGGSDLPVRNARDIPFKKAKNTKWSDLEEVDVVLFQDFRPGKQHKAWAREDVNAVVWCNRGLRGKEVLPRGWSLTTKRLSHDKAGGVTNAVATVYIALRLGQERMKWEQVPDCFKNTLRQIVDATKGGYTCAPSRVKTNLHWIQQRDC
jgi:hypothetical protein